jgi:hypothetical protein
MEIIQYTTQWVKGEVIQGRIAVALAIISFIAFLYFANFQQSFYKGMILPIVFIQMVLLGYGGFQIVKRPSHIEKVAQEMQIQPGETLKKELLKAQNDDKVYSILIPIWAILFLVSLILFLVLKNDFWRGMSFGFIIWFLVAFIFDNFLHQRLKVYLSSLEQLV